MTCRELAEFLWKYMERDLPEQERFHFDAHLSVCPHCVAIAGNAIQGLLLAQACVRGESATVAGKVTCHTLNRYLRRLR